MTADRLREAAREIRETAREAMKPENCHPWGDTSLQPTTPDQWPGEMRVYLGGPWGEQAALWSPTVALAVADWLDTQAADFDFLGTQSEHDIAALRVADLILGGTP